MGQKEQVRDSIVLKCLYSLDPLDSRITNKRPAAANIDTGSLSSEKRESSISMGWKIRESG